MTQQVSSTVLHEDEYWVICDYKGSGWFMPEDFGVRIYGFQSTACWDGYSCSFAIQDKQLQLLHLEISTDEKVAPLLNGRAFVLPDSEDHWICGNVRYLDVQLPIPF
ncbi:MAG: hypothetical protein EOP84_21995, partial [Verrucomicrobiaceae bacterium]